MAYLVATLRGKAQPNPVSWLLWSMIPLLTFFVGISTGVGIEMIITLAAGISPLLVFFASMYKNPRSFQLRGLNLVCVIIAIAGLALWPVTSSPGLAIALLLLADLSSALPTIKKAWQRPSSEFSPTYLISSASMVLALLTITDWQFAAVAYPIYALSANLLIFLLANRKKPLRHKIHR